MYDLISQKSFEELTEFEREFVLKELGSEDDYEQLRELNTASFTALNENISPPKELKNEVLAAFDRKNRKTNPVWIRYAAAVVFIAFGAYLIWPEAEIGNEPIAEKIDKKEEKNQADEKELNDSEKNRQIEEEISRVESADDESSDTPSMTEPENFEIISDEESPTITSEEDIETSEYEEVIHIELADAEGKFEDGMDDSTLQEYADESPAGAEPDITAAPAIELSKSRASNKSVTAASMEVKQDGVSLLSIGGIETNGYVAY